MKAKKKRASKYESKLVINGTFADVIGAAMSNIKVEPKKKKKKATK